MCRTNSDGVLNLVNLPVSRGGCTFGSVSEIQSGWFMLGLNVWFALDATTPTNQLHIDCLSSLATNEVRTTVGGIIVDFQLLFDTEVSDAS